jgi:hypothetical protein
MARKQIAKDGLTVRTADGGIRTHPAIAIERDSRLALARMIRELDLDTEPPPVRALCAAGVTIESRRCPCP